MGLPFLIFVTVTVGVTALCLVLPGLLLPDRVRLRQRIHREFGKSGTAAALSPLFKNLDQLIVDVPDSVVEPEKQAPQKRGVYAGLQEALEHANLPVTPRQLLLLSAILACGLGFAGTWLSGPLAGAGLILLGGLVPLVVVHLKAKARREKYQRQLPSAFDLMARVIRAGQSVTQALQAVADAFEDPIASEFAECQKRQNLGLRPEVTFQELAQRSGNLDMRIFVMAMTIQRQTGGNLSDLLERLAGLVRARHKLRSQVRTLTAEGRLQGWTLFVLPFIVFGIMMVMNRQYAQILLEHPSLLVATGVSMGLGLLWIRKIVNFDV